MATRKPAAKTVVKKTAKRRNPVPPLKSAAAKKVAKKAATRKRNPSIASEACRAAELYSRFTGHDAEEIGRIQIPDPPKSAACIGTCDGLLYTTVRDGVEEKYIHKFRAKDKPLFCVSPNGKQLLLVGGAYDFTDRGIIDRSDIKNRAK